MVFDRLFGLLFGRRGPVGLSIELGTVNSALRKTGYRIRGSGPYMKTLDGGYRWRRERARAVLFPSKEPNPHILVSGMSGFGKSMFFKSVLVDIAKGGISCIVFDGHNEHESVVKGLKGQIYDSRNGGINLLSLDGAAVSDRVASLVSLIGNVYHLGHIQSTKLGQCLKYMYRKFGARNGHDKTLEKEPRVGDLLFEISIFIKNSRTAGERATLLNLQSKISNLNIPAFNRNATASGSLKVGIHSFSVSERMSREARLIYLVELLERIYAGMKDDPKNGGIRQYIMIDESQVLINESEACSGVITKFIEEGRKYGRGVMIVTHMSSWLNKQIVANAATFMAFYSREPSEANYVAKVMTSNFDAEQAVRSKLAALGDGEAMIVSANSRMPRVISTMGLHGRVAHRRERDALTRFEHADRPILLSSFCEKAGVDVARARAFIGKGLDLFVFGEEEWIMNKSNPGVEHEVMVMKIHSLLQGAGIKSYIYDRACGPDLVAYGKEGKIAIEYETGSKILWDTVRMVRRRLERYQKVVVVVNDKSLPRYREALAGINCALIGAADLENLSDECGSEREAGPPAPGPTLSSSS